MRSAAPVAKNSLVGSTAKQRTHPVWPDSTCKKEGRQSGAPFGDVLKAEVSDSAEAQNNSRGGCALREKATGGRKREEKAEVGQEKFFRRYLNGKRKQMKSRSVATSTTISAGIQGLPMENFLPKMKKSLMFSKGVRS